MPLTTAGIHFLPARTDNTTPLADRNKYIKPITLDATPQNLIPNFLLYNLRRTRVRRRSNRVSTVRTRINTGDVASHSLRATLTGLLHPQRSLSSRLSHRLLSQ